MLPPWIGHRPFHRAGYRVAGAGLLEPPVARHIADDLAHPRINNGAPGSFPGGLAVIVASAPRSGAGTSARAVKFCDRSPSLPLTVGESSISVGTSVERADVAEAVSAKSIFWRSSFVDIGPPSSPSCRPGRRSAAPGMVSGATPVLSYSRR
jgi:hypothetical protein